MRTAAVPSHSDKVHHPVAQDPASALTAAFNFLQATPPDTCLIISVLRHQRETTVAVGLRFSCPHAHPLSRASRAIFVASGFFRYAVSPLTTSMAKGARIMHKSILMYFLLVLGYFVLSTFSFTEVSAQSISITSGNGQSVA